MFVAVVWSFCAVLVGGCDATTALSPPPEVVACPARVGPPVDNPRGAVRAPALAPRQDYVIVDGHRYDRAPTTDSREAAEPGPFVISTVCQLGYADPPSELVDGFASHLPVGTAIHRSVDDDPDSVVAVLPRRTLEYRRR